MLIFTRTKDAADKVLKELLLDGFKAKSIHGDKTQAARTTALQEFREGKLPILVATDVAARGLDIQDLPHVINFELPEDPEDYVHRVGRTGRAGKVGDAISLVSSDDLSRLSAISKFLGQKLEATPFPGLPEEASDNKEKLPSKQGRRSSSYQMKDKGRKSSKNKQKT